MRFIVDAQLPPALARWLASQGCDAAHVFDLQLGSATDREIWALALSTDAIVVTKDEDFSVRALVVTPARRWCRKLPPSADSLKVDCSSMRIGHAEVEVQ